MEINKNTFYHYLADVGFGGKTGIDTYFESMQKLREFKTLKDEVRRANISFGQGIAVTQIQMIMALNTVINNGKLMKPYLVDRIEDSKGNTVKQNKPDMIKKVFSDEVSRLNRKYMEAVVSYGTGNGAYIPGYRIGGKTGTAQESGVGGYIKGKYFSSFFAFFPVENPKYALIITINEPKGKIYGAQVALPSVRNIIAKLIEYKRIGPDGKPKKEEETDKKEKVTLVGNLCTATDVIAEDIVLPSMDCGDVIVINNAGSYAAVLSPMQFSSQEKPVEVFLSVNDSVKIN